MPAFHPPPPRHTHTHTVFFLSFFFMRCVFHHKWKKIKSSAINVCDMCAFCVFVHPRCHWCIWWLFICMGPICEIRVAIAEIRGAQKEALFWPDVVSGVTDSYNDSFGHTLNTSYWESTPWNTLQMLSEWACVFGVSILDWEQLSEIEKKKKKKKKKKRERREKLWFKHTKPGATPFSLNF